MQQYFESQEIVEVEEPTGDISSLCESSNTLSFLQSTFSNTQGTAIAQLNSGSVLVQFCVFNNLTNSGQQAAAVYTGRHNFIQNSIGNKIKYSFQ